MKLNKLSFGTGDRFAHQGIAQLNSIIKAKDQHIHISPVWNKSHRKHQIIGTSPEEVRREADQAVAETGWDASYFMDSDHIRMGNVVEYSNFFTIDVADYIGSQVEAKRVDSLVSKHQDLFGFLNNKWSGKQIANALRHDPFHSELDSNFRQLLHYAYKIVGEMDSVLTDVLEADSRIIGEDVTVNLFEHHIATLFLGRF